MDSNVKAGVVYVTLAASGILLYLVYFYAAISNYKCTLKSSYYKLNFALGITGCYYVFINLILGVPLTFTQSQVYGVLAGDVLAFTQGLAFYASLAFVLIIALNRFCIISEKFEFLFEEWRLYLVIASALVYSLIMNGIMYGINCRKHFSETQWYMGNVCSDPTLLSSLSNGNLVANLSLISIIAFLYLLTYYYLRKRRCLIADNASKRRRQDSERKLLYQAIILGFAMTLQVVVFNTFPRIFEALTSRILTTGIGTLYHLVNPALFLCFNKVKMTTANEF